MPEAVTQQVDVAIIGGGIAGLAAAAALRDSGLSLLLVEARALPTFPPTLEDSVQGFDARVSALTPHSVAFLERITAWQAVAARRQAPYRHMTVWDAEGTGAIDFDADELQVPMLGSIVENRLLTAALAERVTGCGSVQLCTPARIADARFVSTGSKDTGEGKVAFSLDDGRAFRCRLLLAADGALSPTRELFSFRTREWDYRQRALVTTAEFTRGHDSTAWQRFLPTGPLALLPLASGDDRLCSIVWSIDEDKADEVEALDDAAFCAALSEASEHRLGEVAACAPRFAFPLRQRHAVDYVQEGVALVADAAHTIHPLAGQGINLGLADVEVLVEEILRACELGLEPGALPVLRRYQRRRKGDNLTMMAAMDGFKNLFGQQAPTLRWLRNTGMRQVASLPALKRSLMRQAMGLGAREAVAESRR